MREHVRARDELCEPFVGNRIDDVLYGKCRSEREEKRGRRERWRRERKSRRREERKRKRVSAQLEFRELRDELGARAAGANEGARPDGE